MASRRRPLAWLREDVGVVGQLSCYNCIKGEASLSILPVRYPPIASWPWIAHALSIILHDTKYIGWFADHYINLFGWRLPSDFNKPPVYDSRRRLDFADVMVWFDTVGHFPMLKCDRVLETGSAGYADFVVDRIRSNAYVIAVADWYYLPCSYLYKRHHMDHHLLVYGYRHAESKFLVADHFHNLKYAFEEVSRSDLERAMRATAESISRYPEDHIWQLIRIDSVDYTLDVNRIRILLDDYVHGRNLTLDNQHLTSFDPPSTTRGVSRGL